MTGWHVPVEFGGYEHVLVIEAESAAAVLAQLREHWATGVADRTLIRPYQMPDGGTLHVRWGRVTVVVPGCITAAAHNAGCGSRFTW